VIDSISATEHENLALLHCSFHALRYIKTGYTNKCTILQPIYILSVTYLLHVSAVLPSSGSSRQNFIETHSSK